VADPNTLAEPLRSSVVGLLNEANEGGSTRVTVVSARRSREQQIALRKAHCGTSDYDVFQKPSDQCRPATARPGSSKHELGLAVDFGGDTARVAQLAGKYGLVKTVSSEPWHYEHRDTAGRAFGELEREQAAGGLGNGSGIGLGDVPGIVTGAASSLPGVGAVFDGLDALKNLAAFVVNPTTWLRALAAIAGVSLILWGIIVLGLDLRGEVRRARPGLEASAGLATSGGAAVAL
jgi:hypothetical protein